MDDPVSEKLFSIDALEDMQTRVDQIEITSDYSAIPVLVLRAELSALVEQVRGVAEAIETLRVQHHMAKKNLEDEIAKAERMRRAELAMIEERLNGW